MKTTGLPAGAIEGIDSRVDEYALVLDEHLRGDFRKFANFFSDPLRLKVLAQLLSRHLDGTPGQVLNVGCGPLATEYFVRPLHRHRIVSFDYTPEFASVYPALRARGYLANTTFFVGDAVAVEFAPETFDLIVMHDLLYEPTLDWPTLFPKYDRFLRRGGLIFLTVLNVRTRGLWRMFGREKPRKRYEIPAILAGIRSRGYQVLACVPCSLESRGPLNQAFKQLLWKVFGLANEYAILARKAST